ncbi:MAG: tRNA (adenosine(37)-N6)-threonylcarbamoyltransferase complex transferase subunit TsaD [Patescibacteria group bacterium]|nr:tRNA (adenosine(37)-N6)-threonylcarbamoyltransferase complex transferase subunit TsaD [Patescibacteria group bacterium]
MRILALETSCDETAAAVVENGTKIISQTIASSLDLHQKTGGVIPEIAAREQVKCVIPVIEEALKNAGILGYYDIRKNKEKAPNIAISKYRNIDNSIDALAVTVGPGLIGSLLVGVETAKTLALVWKKPIVPVNHLVGHIYANWINTNVVPAQAGIHKNNYHIDSRFRGNDKEEKINNNLPQFPALCLVVSGGHTDLVLMKNHGQLKYLGGTRDDAAGECFDKSARLLGLNGYFGGPAIAAAAQQITDNRKQTTIRLPRPLINEDNLDFSFSGLKTAVMREVEKLKAIKQFNNETINAVSYELQEAITDVLTAKVIKAAEIYQPKTILLGGGVAANQRLREKLKFEIENSLKIKNLKFKIYLYIPPPKLCNDNAFYIASCAFFNYHPVSWKKISANPGLTIV